MNSSPSARRYSISFFVSLSIHAIALFFLLNQTKISKSFVAFSPKKINQRALHSIDLSNVKVISRQKLTELKSAMKQQIVANELKGKKESPKNSRFMGEANQRVDRQTIAATNGSFKAAGYGDRHALVEQSAAESTPSTKRTHQSHESSSKHLSLKELGTFGLAMPTHKNSEAENFLAENEKKNHDNKSAKSKGIESGDKSLSGLAKNNDFIEDVPLGDTTSLNTTENKYYGFYSRIRQKLEQYWGSTIQSKARSLYKSGRRLPASENLITAIVVTLDDKGNIVDIKIEGTSGIRELDQAAIESFNKAGPFPNPPKGLIVGGRATIQWGFVVKS